MESENFEKVLMKESLHRSSQNNMNQAEVGYNAKWFRRGGFFVINLMREKTYSEEEVIQLLIKFNQEIQEVEDVRGWFKQFKKK